MKITLCGSARFESEFHYWNERLTFMGFTVYSLAIFPSYKSGNKDWYSDTEKEHLDLIHLAKIEESDSIFVIDISRTDNRGSTYIGDSTRKEINWARIRGKEIEYASKQLECENFWKEK